MSSTADDSKQARQKVIRIVHADNLIDRQRIDFTTNHSCLVLRMDKSLNYFIKGHLGDLQILIVKKAEDAEVRVKRVKLCNFIVDFMNL